jgi:hypothetical protein
MFSALVLLPLFSVAQYELPSSYIGRISGQIDADYTAQRAHDAARQAAHKARVAAARASNNKNNRKIVFIVTGSAVENEWTKHGREWLFYNASDKTHYRIVPQPYRMFNGKRIKLDKPTYKIQRSKDGEIYLSITGGNDFETLEQAKEFVQ